jgi:hypothetical protein
VKKSSADNWFLQHSTGRWERLAVVTWVHWDCWTSELQEHPQANQWVNLPIPFETAFGIEWRNLQEAVGEVGLQWDGRLHCRLDDARNTARLLVKLMRRGVHISITGSSGATASTRAGAGAGAPTSTTALLVHRNLIWLMRELLLLTAATATVAFLSEAVW